MPKHEEPEEGNIRTIPEKPQMYPAIDDLIGNIHSFAANLSEGILYSQVYETMGVNPDKIVLLTGPPGTGKTFSLKAINNTMNMDAVFNISHYYNPEQPEQYNIMDAFQLLHFKYDIGKYGTAYINRGSKIIQQFFDKMFFIAKHKPVLIELDEADALVMSRKQDIQQHSEDRKNLETLMKNLQVAHDTPDVYVVLMTNYEKAIDEAVLRSGRVDRRYNIPLPDIEDRYILFERLIGRHNQLCKYQVIRKYNSWELAENSDGFSNSDIAAVIEKSIKYKVKQIINADKDKIVQPGYITQKTIKDIIGQHNAEFNHKYVRKEMGFNARRS